MQAEEFEVDSPKNLSTILKNMTQEIVFLRSRIEQVENSVKRDTDILNLLLRMNGLISSGFAEKVDLVNHVNELQAQVDGLTNHARNLTMDNARLMNEINNKTVGNIEEKGLESISDKADKKRKKE